MEQIFNLEIPTGSSRQRTLFDIAKFPNRENVISNWYSYYFDMEEEHRFKDVFIRSLLSVVKKKFGKDFKISKSFVRREVVCENGKRIDLVIYGTGSDHGKQIIIENKIYHWLHNDLMSYWNHKKTDEDKKLGIVLSLSKESFNNVSDKFYNILHQELMAQVRLNVDLTNTDPKQAFYYQDFLSAMDNITNEKYMNNQVDFYFKNMEILNKAVATKQAAIEYIISQLRFAADELGLTIGGDKDSYRWFSIREDKRVVYTIVFNCLFELPQKLGIIIELDANGLKQVDKLDNLLAGKIEEGGLKHKAVEVKPYYVHYASNYFDITPQELIDLKTFVINKISNIYAPIMSEIIKALKD
jgi:hypothetical protein